MKYISPNDKIQLNLGPISTRVRDLYASRATAPDETVHPIICRHFKIRTQQAIQYEIDVELSKLFRIPGMCKAVSL